MSTMCRKHSAEEMMGFMEREELLEDELAGYDCACSQCDQYVSVNEMSGEAEIGGEYFFDICDDCEFILRKRRLLSKKAS